MRYSAEL